MDSAWREAGNGPRDRNFEFLEILTRDMMLYAFTLSVLKSVKTPQLI